MPGLLPIVLIPGLNCSGRVYAPQVSALWRCGPVMVANHMQGASISEIARNILSAAPPRFALAGFSMGGYIAFEILRQAGQRVLRVAFLDTSARPDTPEDTAVRMQRIELAQAGRFLDDVNERYPLGVDESRHRDQELRRLIMTMAEEVGPEAFVRHMRAMIARADSRPTLGAIECPALVLVGASDQLTPPSRSEEIASGIAGARLVIVPRAGHFATLEKPEAVNEALAGWLCA